MEKRRADYNYAYFCKQYDRLGKLHKIAIYIVLVWMAYDLDKIIKPIAWALVAGLASHTIWNLPMLSFFIGSLVGIYSVLLRGIFFST